MKSAMACSRRGKTARPAPLYVAAADLAPGKDFVYVDAALRGSKPATCRHGRARVRNRAIIGSTRYHDIMREIDRVEIGLRSLPSAGNDRMSTRHASGRGRLEAGSRRWKFQFPHRRRNVHGVGAELAVSEWIAVLAEFDAHFQQAISCDLCSSVS